MKRAMLATLILTTTSLFSTTAFSQKEKADVGKLEFEVHCAICHGMDAKGNGPYVSSLKVAPPDLTLQLPFCFEVRSLSGSLVSSAPE